LAALQQETGDNGELTDAQKFADIVDDLARLCDVVFVPYHHDLFHRKHSQPVSDERVVHANAQPNLPSDRSNIQNLLSPTVDSQHRRQKRFK